ncbi:MAG: hypothetical protein OER21_07825 [Gemmatimonadota bacterium]|nr:hypothetical protein [Gemmatimonadota bacterium]
MRKRVVVLGVTLVLGACGGTEREPQPPAAASPAVSGDTVLAVDSLTGDTVMARDTAH